MEQLLIKQSLNPLINRDQFIEDVECLFSVLKDSYGLYEFYGDERFLRAKTAILNNLCTDEFNLEFGIDILQKIYTLLFRTDTSPSVNRHHRWMNRLLIMRFDTLNFTALMSLTARSSGMIQTPNVSS